MLKKRPLLTALAVVLVALAIYYALIPVVGPHYTKVCSKGEYGPPDNCEYWDAVSAIVRRFFVGLDEHNGLVSAFAGIAVAAFTAVLWRSTEKLWTAGERQLRLAREEFNATHRPQVIVHSARFISVPSGDGDGLEMVGATLLCFNIGSSAAESVEVRGQIISTKDLGVDVMRETIPTNGVRTVKSGLKLRFSVISERTLRDTKLTGVPTYCVGTISYSDQSGSRRETGFCFKLNSPLQAWPAWVSSGSPEYVYAY